MEKSNLKDEDNTINNKKQDYNSIIKDIEGIKFTIASPSEIRKRIEKNNTITSNSEIFSEPINNLNPIDYLKTQHTMELMKNLNKYQFKRKSLINFNKK